MSFGLEMLWEMSAIGLAVFVLLAGMFAATVYLAFDGWLVIRRARKKANAYGADFDKHMQRGQFEAAAGLDAASGGPMGAVLATAVREFVNIRSASPSVDESVMSIESTVERASNVAMNRLRSGLGALATIGSISPFVGLFGTVVGIVQSFQDIAATGETGLTAVAAGIAEALYATALGILVAIPAVVMFNYLSARIDAFQAETNAAAGGLLDAIRKTAWAANANRAAEPEAAE